MSRNALIKSLKKLSDDATNLRVANNTRGTDRETSEDATRKAYQLRDNTQQWNKDHKGEEK